MIINKRLRNGVRVVMESIPYVQSVSVGIWVRAGSVDEDDSNSGVSHFIEHMLFKGTEKRSAKQIAQDVDWIGGHMNAFTGKESTCYYIKVLESNLETACDILLDMFMNSKFDPTEMEREKSVICEEIKMTEDSPEDDAHDLLCEQVFRGTLLERPVIGTPESLAGINRNRLKHYMNQEYTASHVVIAAAGAVDPDGFCSMLEGKLEALALSKPGKEQIEGRYAPEYKVKVKDVEQSHICIGVPGVSLEDRLHYPLALLSSIMGGSMSSRLFQNVREERGLAYSVYSMSNCYTTHGIFSIYAGVAHEKVEEAIAAIAGELYFLKAAGVTDDELHMAKEQMKSSYTFSQENVNSRMFSIGRGALLLSRIKTPQEIIEEVDAVTMDDIREAAGLIADIADYSGVLITRKDKNLKKLLRA